MAQIDFSGSHFSAFPSSVYCVYTLDNGVSVLLGYKSECLPDQRFSTLTTLIYELTQCNLKVLSIISVNFCRALVNVCDFRNLGINYPLLCYRYYHGTTIGLVLLLFAIGLVLLLTKLFPKSTEESDLDPDPDLNLNFAISLIIHLWTRGIADEKSIPKK